LHFVGRYPNFALALHSPFEDHSAGYTHASLVDHTIGSVHIGLSMNQLNPESILEEHFHSYEESFYILEGSAVVGINRHACRLGPGDFGVLKVGTPHAWRNAGQGAVLWLGMTAPQPKARGREIDTFFAKSSRMAATMRPCDSSQFKGAPLGHFYPSGITPTGQTRAVVADAPDIFLLSLIDQKLGAHQHRVLFVEYQPGASIGVHDHPFEEAYFILSGEVCGRRYMDRGGLRPCIYEYW
jgi:quercetin dioxygenase-like cupin family protein